MIGEALSGVRCDVLHVDVLGAENGGLVCSRLFVVAAYSQRSPRQRQLLPSLAGRCLFSHPACASSPSNRKPFRTATETEHSVACGVSASAATNCCSTNFIVRDFARRVSRGCMTRTARLLANCKGNRGHCSQSLYRHSHHNSVAQNAPGESAFTGDSVEQIRCSVFAVDAWIAQLPK